jgi:polyhydroxyalkanoate synthesis regulator phasin
MKRLVWLPLAGFLLIGGAAVAAAAPGVADRAVGLLDDLGAGIAAASSPAPSDGSGEEPVKTEGFGVVRDGVSLLDEVLSDLVSSGVITQEQSEAITQALTDKAEERRAEFEAERERLQEMWTQIRGFLEDDVITEDEIAQLPANNPFSNLQDILADGQITRDELESVAPFGGTFIEGRGHFGPGPGGPRHHVWFGGPNDDLSTDSNSDSDSNSGTDSNADSNADSNT